MRHHPTLACLAAASLLLVFPVTAQIEQGLQVGFRDFAVLADSGSGNNAPARASVMTDDPLGRLFVNDQRGPLYNIAPDGSAVTPYLDLRTVPGLALDTSSGERGFQSFAFHPDFAATNADGFGKFYTLHSSSDRTPPPTFPFRSNSNAGSGNVLDTVLLEWSVADPFASTYAAGNGTTPREVLRLEQPAGNHNGGLIAFNTSDNPGTDRTNLYVALGDGGSGGDPWEIAEDPSSPYGKILRIDPLDPDGTGSATYGTVADNAFASDNDSGTLAEVYAFGLRNPQRFGWDPQTGDLFAADIGQNRREEISLITNGGHFGWDAKEGSLTFEGPHHAEPHRPDRRIRPQRRYLGSG